MIFLSEKQIMTTKQATRNKFWLKPLALAKNLGFRAKELRKLESLVKEHRMMYTK